MFCTLDELRKKDVVNVINGEILGRVDDLELDANTATIQKLILYGRPKFFGIFGERDNCVIAFHQIRLIGKDTILVELKGLSECTICTNKKQSS